MLVQIKKEKLLLPVLLIISGVLVVTDQIGWLDPVRGFLERPVVASQARLYTFKDSSSRFLDNFASRRCQEEEISQLREKIRQLAVKQGQLNVCLEENIKARRLLGAPLPPSWHFLPATVIGTSGKLRINQGQEAGVEEGMMVVADNVLAGKVISAEEKSALIQPLTDTGLRIPVVVKKLLSEDSETIKAMAGVQARGLFQVEPSKETLVKEILQEEDVQMGDLVLTSGESGWLPDLVIGRVKEVSGREAELSKTAQVELLIDYHDLRTVFVVIDH